MALRTLVLTLALALVATVGFAAGEEEAPATAMEKEMVTDPTTGEMVTAPAYGGTITYPLNDEPPNADIYLAGIHAGSAIDGVLEKLGVADWGTDRSEWDFAGLETPLSYMTGQLAESWSQPDDTTIIVKIRRGVRWHDKPPMNGRELTAKDLEYNYHRAMGLGSGFTELPGTYSSPLTNARLIFESITATDDATVVFKLKEPFLGGLRTILDDLVNWIYPPEVIREHGDVTDWRNLVGTGPFMLTDWTRGSSMTLDKNPDYWGFDEKYPQNRLPYVDQVRVLVMKEPATRMAALRTGKVDLVGPAGNSQIRSLDQVVSMQRTNPEIVVWTVVGASTSSVGLNTSRPPFDDVRVRKAMQMALDLETINSSFFGGFAGMTPYGQVGPNGTGYYIPFEEWPEEVRKGHMYDPEGAEKLLDEAGYPRAAAGIRFKTVYTHFDRYDPSYTELLASYWREIGVDVEIRVVTIAEFNPIRKAHDFEMVSHEMGYGTLGNPLLGPSRFLSDGAYNSVAALDPEFDAMYAAAAAATTIEEQQRLVKAVDFYPIERHWCVGALANPTFEAVQPWIQGYAGEGRLGYAQRHWMLARLWIDQELKESMGF